MCETVVAAAAQPLRPFVRLTKEAMEALRYRAEDVGRTITRSAVREARARELQRELLNNEKLQEYFQEHEAERVRGGRGACTGLWGVMWKWSEVRV